MKNGLSVTGKRLKLRDGLPKGPTRSGALKNELYCELVVTQGAAL